MPLDGKLPGAGAPLPAPGPANPQASVLHRIAALRDRLVTNPDFRRWAAAFPLTRPIAKRRTRSLFDLCAGFVYSQILSACLQLGVFDILAEGPLPAAALSARIDLPLAATERLLAAAAALDLVERRGAGRFGLGSLGAAVVGNAAVAAMVAHHSMLYADLADPVALLRGEPKQQALHRYWAYASADAPQSASPSDVGQYTTLMAASQPLVADEVLDAYNVRRHRLLLDIGGGSGLFAQKAAGRAPDLRVMVFDLPAVAAQATTRFAQAGLAPRAAAHGGSFLTDPLPSGADLMSLVRVIHDHDDDSAMTILRAARRAAPRGGRLLLAEPMAGTRGAEPMGDAYFGMYLLAMGQGRPRTAATLSAMLRQAGFAKVRPLKTHTPLLVSVLLAETHDQ
jgi:demethylspheroidene O-methyltransferase